MESYKVDTDYFIMNDGRKEDFAWETSVKLMVGREEEFGMYLEEREGRKRKWQGEKMMRRDGSEEKELRKVPPKKVIGE